MELRTFLWTLPLALSACTTAPATPATNCTQPPLVGDFPKDIGAILASRCQTCHRDPPQNGAHFPLLKFEETQQPFGLTDQRRWQRMAEVIQVDGSPHMPYKDAPQLTNAEFQALDTWLKQCAPPVAEGTGADSGEQ